MSKSRAWSIPEAHREGHRCGRTRETGLQQSAGKWHAGVSRVEEALGLAFGCAGKQCGAMVIGISFASGQSRIPISVLPLAYFAFG